MESVPSGTTERLAAETVFLLSLTGLATLGDRCPSVETLGYAFSPSWAGNGGARN